MAKVLQPQHNLPLMCTDYTQDVTTAPMATSTTGTKDITPHIAKRSVRILLESEGFNIQRILNAIDPIDEDIDRKKVERMADVIKKLIKEAPSEFPSVAELTEQQWVIHAGNVHSEYMHLAHQLFEDNVNWGRIIAFIGFSATYCLYAMQRGIQETIVESVCAWMVQVLQQDLREWFHQHSWVSGLLCRNLFCIFQRVHSITHLQSLPV